MTVMKGKDYFSLGTHQVGGFRKRVPLDGETEINDRGFSTVPLPDRAFDFEVEIDWEKLIDSVGYRAAHSSRGKATAVHGAIKVTARKR